jgi:glucose/arabinose dehydrogenase
VRTLRRGPEGALYAVLSSPGRVVRFPSGADGSSRDEVVSGLERPYGLAFHDGWMYVAETHRVVRFAGPDWGGTPPEVVVPDLPTGGHWTREIAFGPDGRLYLSVGSSCNVCEEDHPYRAAVWRFRPDGSGAELVARGVRNAAGLAAHPTTGEMWASQNERDHLGDDLPPEEINVLADGLDFGWPYCYGDGIPNPEYDDQAGVCADAVPPALELQAHSAPLGMTFYDGDAFPAEYRGDLFVAFHGSWNRRMPTGYKLVRVRVADGRPVAYEDFATGWLSPDGEVRGRPVYPAVGADGALYLSDDGANRIWRIRYIGNP